MGAIQLSEARRQRAPANAAAQTNATRTQAHNTRTHTHTRTTARVSTKYSVFRAASHTPLANQVCLSTSASALPPPLRPT
eukprot:8688101-Alexandrium_andersonii.AAC.1